MTKPEEQTQIAKFKLGVVSFYAGMGKSRIQGYVNAIKSINPTMKLASYVVMSEYRGSAAATDADYTMIGDLERNGWWAKDAATGNKVQWTTQYSTYQTNVTGWTRTDANGRRFPQYKAKFDTDNIFGGVTGLDYVYIDQVNETPSVAADYMLAGNIQASTDPTVSAAHRKGHQDYFTSLRSMNPGIKVMANAATLAPAEYINQLDGAFMECQMGKSWSLETWSGWDNMMARYRTEMAQTKAPHDVIFQACGPTADPTLMRYGLASAMLLDGYYAFTVTGQMSPPWFDEYSAKIGTPAEAPPAAATASGIWMRKYTNGVVLVNPSKTTALTIDIGTGYKHLTGTQDPNVNNGLAARTITLQPRTGMLMVKQ